MKLNLSPEFEVPVLSVFFQRSDRSESCKSALFRMSFEKLVYWN